MKTKLQILVTILSIVFLMAKASGQQAAPIDPQTGLPESVSDPATGLPADGSPPFKDTNGVATWIDPTWKDPDKVLASFSIPDWSLTEAVRRLSEQFTNDFDIILPNAIPGFDPTQINVELELKNVKASEIFSAMNLQFELNESALRWELTLNGSRPTAILRSLPRLGPPPPPAPPQIRKVFSVAYMLGDYPGTNDADKLSDISDTIVHVWGEAGVRVGTVNTYPPGQLLIISGTADQVDLAEQTLRELGHKADYDHGNSHPVAQPTNP